MQKSAIVLLIALFCSPACAAGPGALVVSVDQKPALSLQLPEGWTSEFDAKKNQSDIKQPKFEIHINLWNVPKVQTLAAANPLVDAIIKGEVTDFRVTETKDVTIAGAKGRLLVGTGSEADDGDPSFLEVFLFSVGGKIFLLCAHGEGNGAAAAHDSLVGMLATAKSS
jgi:hypothetical protein